MAKILLQRDINKKYKNKQPQTKKHNMTEYRKKCYSSQEWKHLRQTQVFNHPLCELSLVDDVIKPAVDVHHLISPFQSASSVEECWLLFFVVDLPFAVDLELVPDLTLFSTSFEENSNESRLLLFSDDVGCAFFV